MFEPMFNPVPAQMKAYNTQMRSRPKFTKAQLMIARRDARILTQADRRPHTDEGWHQIAVEANTWLHQTSPEDRPAAMNEMRQWVIQTGLNWDLWWGYCCRLNDACPQQSLDRQRVPELKAQLETPAGWAKNVREDAPAPEAPSEEAVSSEPLCSKTWQSNSFGGDRRATAPSQHLPEAITMKTTNGCRSTITEGMGGALTDQKQRWQKILAEKKVREENWRVQAEEWAAKDKDFAERHESWKQNVRQYTTEVLGHA